MTIENSIKTAMARMIERQRSITDVVVMDWEEVYDTYAYGGCDTCGPEYQTEYNVIIWYKDSKFPDQYSMMFSYRGKFTDLIKELDA